MTALALMGLLPRSAIWSARRLAFDGEDLNASSIRGLRGNRMAMVFQEPTTALNPCYTIGDQLCEAHRRHKGSSRRAARERAIEILEKVGVNAAPERLAQYPHQLSGGLRQRVLISMALICDPALLIADEPTAALDVTIQAQILRLLIDLQRNLGIAIVLITHDLGVVARVAHRVAVMYAGEVVETATAAHLFAAPHHPYTRGLMASVLVPGKTPSGERLAAIPGTVPSLIGEICGCAFRNRCPHATATCADPIAPRSAADHLWRCIFAELPTETT